MTEQEVKKRKHLQTKMKIRTQQNFVFDETCCEKPSQKPSLTVPDQALTVGEILERHRRGLSYPEGAGIYDDDLGENYPDISKLTKMEKIALSKDYAELVQQKKKDFEELQNRLSAERLTAEPVQVNSPEPSQTDPTDPTKTEPEKSGS